MDDGFHNNLLSHSPDAFSHVFTELGVFYCTRYNSVFSFSLLMDCYRTNLILTVSAAYLRVRLICKCGVSASAAYLQVRRICKCGVSTSAVYLQVWRICKCDVSASAAYLRVRLICKCGVSASAAYLQVRLICKCGVSASAAYLRVRSICKCGLSASAAYLQMRRICKCGVSASAAYLRVRLICKCGVSASAAYLTASGAQSTVLSMISHSFQHDSILWYWDGNHDNKHNIVLVENPKGRAHPITAQGPSFFESGQFSARYDNGVGHTTLEIVSKHHG
ncbi:hypothetical protein QZH41_004040 [Actinostola sp. cb2023]|nr:hypothetical protein QZH41_004040 [Actinostola sp. cb2023]